MRSDTVVNVVAVQCDLWRVTANQGQKCEGETTWILGQTLSGFGGIQKVSQDRLSAVTRARVFALYVTILSIGILRFARCVCVECWNLCDFVVRLITSVTLLKYYNVIQFSKVYRRHRIMYL